MGIECLVDDNCYDDVRVRGLRRLHWRAQENLSTRALARSKNNRPYAFGTALSTLVTIPVGQCVPWGLLQLRARLSCSFIAAKSLRRCRETLSVNSKSKRRGVRHSQGLELQSAVKNTPTERRVRSTLVGFFAGQRAALECSQETVGTTWY